MPDTEQDGVAEPGQRSFPIQAATFSLLAPLVVLTLGVLNVIGSIQMREARIWLGIVNLGLLVCGLGLGIAALACRGKQPVRGVVSRAVIGIAFNGLLLAICSLGFVTVARTARRARANREREAAQADQEGRDAFLKYPGWLGGAQHAGAQISVGSLHRNSPSGRKMMGRFTARFQVLNFSVQNGQSDQPILLEPGSVRLHLADGTVLRALSHNDTLATARERPEQWVRKYGGPYRVPPGTALMDAPVFVPPDLDLTQVVGISVLINGETVIMDGRHYTAAQKQELLRFAQERQATRPATSQATPGQKGQQP